MPLVIDDQILAQAGLTQREALIEFSCRLFEMKRLPKADAARMAGLDRVAFDIELGKRRIDPFGYTIDDLEHDLTALDQVLGKQ